MPNLNPDITIPSHIAIIMDGNGRWAKQRHKPRIFGHQQGVKTVRSIVEYAAQIGVKYLTLYSFSTENWSRPKAEIASLFGLLRRYVVDDLEQLNARGVCVRVLGSKNGLGQDMIDLLERVETRTSGNDDFYLNIAFNYGGRDEIVRAAHQYALELAKKSDKGMSDIAPNEVEFESYLDTAGLPDPELIIRTSGECRISNFLLWQAAYSEFVFADVLWPDFDATDLNDAILLFNQRTRRFGGVDILATGLTG